MALRKKVSVHTILLEAELGNLLDNPLGKVALQALSRLFLRFEKKLTPSPGLGIQSNLSITYTPTLYRVTGPEGPFFNFCGMLPQNPNLPRILPETTPPALRLAKQGKMLPRHDKVGALRFRTYHCKLLQTASFPTRFFVMSGAEWRFEVSVCR